MQTLDPTRPSIRFSVDKGPCRIAPALTAVESQLHRRLFSTDRSRMPMISDAEIHRILRELRAKPDLEPFRLWLVGSRLDPDKGSADIDLVLSPCTGTSLSDASVEQALWYCRNFGLYESHLACLIDPCFRREGATLAIAPLRPHTVLRTSKLYSPKLAKLVRDGRLVQYRRFGRFSIEFLRKAEETSYYEKLPSRTFDNSPSFYLRPAFEIPIVAKPS